MKLEVPDLRDSIVTKRSKQTALELSEAVNYSGFDVENTCTAMAHQHRTLQQRFTQLCIMWLMTCAEDDYKELCCDARNISSHFAAEELLKDYTEEMLVDLAYDLT